MKMLPVEFTNDRQHNQEATELETRRELIRAIAERYRTANRADKRKILEEFTEVAYSNDADQFGGKQRKAFSV